MHLLSFAEAATLKINTNSSNSIFMMKQNICKLFFEQQNNRNKTKK